MLAFFPASVIAGDWCFARTLTLPYALPPPPHPTTKSLLCSEDRRESWSAVLQGVFCTEYAVQNTYYTRRFLSHEKPADANGLETVDQPHGIHLLMRQ